MENTTIKSWAEEDRPREKLLLKGKNALSDSELLAILIRTGTKQASAVELAREILSKCSNDLTQLSRLSVSDLAKEKGMGEVKAITIIAALELGRRRREKEALTKNKITNSKDVFELLSPELSDLNHEEFYILFLDRAQHVKTKERISSGGIAGTVVDPKIIFKKAVEHLASGIILCHNHPSGNTKPSDADISLTKKLKEAGNVLEVQVLDHLIVAGDNYFSFADDGIL